ncbi:MAG: ABC transporter [delta proteobacterium MLS_D]|nr:MAG: ABC transporter [delta proteobacterium MLS_D]
MKLAVHDLSVTYLTDDRGGLLALDRFDLALTPGRVTALVGESGSGKTTVGKALMGLLHGNARVEGSIRFDGIEMNGAEERRLNEMRWSRIAMVFQNGAVNLNPLHRIIDQVAEPLVQKAGFARDEARIRAVESMEALELDPALGRRFPHELSSGENQRALLAMAFIMNPEVVILDEPTASLDAVTKVLVSRYVTEARNRGAAILLVTHDLDLVASVADDAVVLYLGRTMETLPADSLFSSSLHPYTWALVRSYPGRETHRDLGGIRGDAFYRIVHRHSEHDGAIRRHSHVIGADSPHVDGHRPPGGCLFRGRCTQAIGDCAEREVPLMQVNGHLVRCLRGGVTASLDLGGIEKRYGDVVALHSTDLSLRSGELFCLVGESGSGKTTLAMIAAGALKPDKGLRIFEKRDMDCWIDEDRRSLAMRIGIIHQYPARSVSHRLTTFDIVAEPLMIRGRKQGMDEIRRRVLNALRDAHLATEPDFLGRHPHELNMGALQRLCIARALVTGPSLIVADEPTNSLDPSVQAKVLKMIMDLQVEKGLTLLLVTHDLGLARKTADRIGVMMAGRLVEVGPAARVLNRFRHPYTGFLLNGDKPGANRRPALSGGCPFASRCPRAKEVCFREPPGVTGPDRWDHTARCHFPLSGT